MRVSQFRLAALALTSGILLSGCAYDMYGDPYGYGYGNYGYGYPYGGYGYGYDPFGWYGDYYYPGTGIYVYDRSRTRHVWSGDQQRYWTQRRDQWQHHHSGTTATNENWGAWDRSHWRNHANSGTSATSTGSWDRTRGNWNRSSVETRSSSDRGQRGSRGDHGHHHGDRDD